MPPCNDILPLAKQFVNIVYKNIILIRDMTQICSPLSLCALYLTLKNNFVIKQDAYSNTDNILENCLNCYYAKQNFN